MTRQYSFRFLLIIGLWLGLTFPASSLVVASKPFTENRLLAEMIAQLIEADPAFKDQSVERQLNLGATGIIFDALRQGAIDIYPEYTGTALTALLNEPVISDPEQAWRHVHERFSERYQLEWLPPLGFNNTYALMMNPEQADALQIEKISDLKGQTLKIGLTHEFFARPDGWPGLQKRYQLDFSASQVSGMEHGLAYSALLSHQIDLMDAYSTDGKIKKYGLRLLQDDLNYFPPYQAAILVRQQTLQKYPSLRKTLTQLSGQLDEAKMQALNAQVEEENQPLPRVARRFLNASGVISSQIQPKASADNQQFLGFLWNQRQQLLMYIKQHLMLTGIAVLLATLIGVPLGVAIARFPHLGKYVMGAVGLLQTIPGLALLGFLVPVMGTGFQPALFALTLYALLPIVRNSFTGMREVPVDMLEAARGLGLAPGQILFKIEMPLAANVIMAGIRTATVITIGTATLAAFIGAGGLGDPIITGLSLKNMYWILMGVIPAALLAIMADLLLASLERLFNPHKR